MPPRPHDSRVLARDTHYSRPNSTLGRPPQHLRDSRSTTPALGRLSVDHPSTCTTLGRPTSPAPGRSRAVSGIRVRSGRPLMAPLSATGQARGMSTIPSIPEPDPTSEPGITTSAAETKADVPTDNPAGVTAPVPADVTAPVPADVTAPVPADVTDPDPADGPAAQPADLSEQPTASLSLGLPPVAPSGPPPAPALPSAPSTPSAPHPGPGPAPSMPSAPTLAPVPRRPVSPRRPASPTPSCAHCTSCAPMTAAGPPASPRAWPGVGTSTRCWCAAASSR